MCSLTARRTAFVRHPSAGVLRSAPPLPLPPTSDFSVLSLSSPIGSFSPVCRRSAHRTDRRPAALNDVADCPVLPVRHFVLDVGTIQCPAGGPLVLCSCSQPLLSSPHLPEPRVQAAMHLSLASLFATLVLTHNALAAPSSASSNASSGNAGGPVVDLGKYGKWLGTVQNNGTVHSWKGTSSLASCSCTPSTSSPKARYARGLLTRALHGRRLMRQGANDQNFVQQFPTPLLPLTTFVSRVSPSPSSLLSMHRADRLFLQPLVPSNARTRRSRMFLPISTDTSPRACSLGRRRSSV